MVLRRVLLLDMLLGNPDRLPCGRLMWAGNSGNLLAGCDALPKATAHTQKKRALRGKR
jgi:hypothetical protein